MKCQICGSEKGEKVMLKSFRSHIYEKEWEYYKCDNCGCLQIIKVPDEIAELYNDGYESFNQEGKISISDILFRCKRMYEIGGKSFIGSLVSAVYAYGDYTFLRNVKENSNILDVGCGYGELLSFIGKINNKKNIVLDGIDPYLESDRKKSNVVNLYKSDIQSFKSDYQYDIVMMNHSFEHMDSPREVLNNAKRLLKKDGILSIEIPTINVYLWEKFGIFIDSLDPPYHLYIHTIESMEYLLNECGFEIIKISNTISPNIVSWVETHRDKKDISFMKRFIQIVRNNRENRTLSEQKKGNITRFICKLKQ